MTTKDNNSFNVSQALRALTENVSLRSETDRLRDIFDDVEATLKSGITREKVLSTLHDQGFTMTLASFKSALQRIRKERARHHEENG